MPLRIAMWLAPHLPPGAPGAGAARSLARRLSALGDSVTVLAPDDIYLSAPAVDVLVGVGGLPEGAPIQAELTVLWAGGLRGASRLRGAAELIVVGSEGEATRLLRSNGLHSAQVAVVPEGLELGAAPLLPRDRDRYRIVAVGAVASGASWLWRVFRLVRLGEPLAELHVFGDSRGGAPPRDDRIHHLGLATPDRLADGLRSAGLMLVADPDGSELAIWTARAAGVPMVGRHGNDPGDIHAAAAIVNLLRNDGLRMRLGAEARRQAERERGWEPIARRWHTVLADVLAARRTVPAQLLHRIRSG